MTIAYAMPHGRSLASDLWAGVDTLFDRARASWMQYRTYRRTLAELRELPDRMLRDLDISRGELSAIARRAAYGN